MKKGQTSRGLLATLILALGLAVGGDAFAAKPFCGDGKCNGGETAASCSVDCSVEPPPEDVCDDGFCGPTESFESCPLDCNAPQCDNDGVCNAGEDCLSCGDCP